MNNLKTIYNNNIKVIETSYNYILKSAEKDEVTKEFIELVTLNDNSGSLESFHCEQLKQIIGNLGFELYKNPVHDVSFIKNLASFLGNINDDYYFSLEKINNIFMTTFHDENNETQSLRTLIDAAKHNGLVYYEANEKIMQRREIIRNEKSN